MLLTEELLAPYRNSPEAIVSLIGPDRLLPREWYSSTHEQFESMWRADGDGPEHLAVTPVLAFTKAVPPLAQSYEWHATWHQCGAYSNHSVMMIATILKPNPVILQSLNAIAQRFYYAESGHFNKAQMTASLFARYIADLADIGLDCEASWRLLEEAIYPVDATQRNLDIIALSTPRLSELTGLGERTPRYSNDPSILLLTENSD